MIFTENAHYNLHGSFGGICLFFIFLILWLIISARFSVETVVVGAIVSGLVLFFVCKNLNYRPSLDFKKMRKVLLWIQYVFTLLAEITKAAYSMIRIVFCKKINVSPCVMFFRTKLETDALQVVLANSITITPGSVIVELTDGLYCVHCLTHEVADTIEDSVFEQKLLKIEKS